MEAAWWIWAALSFAPISQVFPFIYPMADRYLYFVLPGLIGGVTLAGRDLARSLIPSESALAAPLARGAAVMALVILTLFAVRGHDRARIWASNTAIFLDGAMNYPHGIEGSILRALRAVREGDRDEAIQALQAAHARGFYVFESLLSDPALAPLRGDPRFEALIQELATELIESRRAKPNTNLFDLPRLAEAHLLLGQMDEAIAVLDRAAALRGSDHPFLRQRIAAMREYAEGEQRKRARAAGSASGPAER
jgi:tetratricopeptide (TPR) repeat protein